jgi:pimeloyl-ACP methyl ester carboxylesterase
VLILDSMVPDAATTETLGRLLANRFYVLCPDRPGFGESPPLVPFTWAGIRQSVDEALGDLGVRRAIVIAHSITTYEALDLALHGNVQIDGLYLMGAIGGLDAPVREAYVVLAAQVRQDRPSVRRLYLEQVFEPAFAAAHPDVLARFAADFDAVDTDTVATQLEAMGELPDLRGELHRISAPTVVRTGIADTGTPIQWSRDVAARIPGAVLEEVPDRRHFLLMDDERATHLSIQRFLRRYEA